MTKTALTLDLEKTLYAYWEDLGGTAVDEVTMPDDLGIVDTLVMQDENGQRVWRCFELKVTASDFHSHAKLSFIGNYNYFVLPAKLYTKLAAEIPAGIGVMTYRAFDAAKLAATADVPLAPGQLTIVRPARFQTLAVDEAALTTRFIASLDREVRKAKQKARGLSGFSVDELAKELRRRTRDYDVYDPDANLYDRFAAELQNTTIDALQEEVDALASEVAAAKLASGGQDEGLGVPVTDGPTVASPDTATDAADAGTGSAPSEAQP